MEWETVIGLEVHVQLATQSKLFSSSATKFGAQPNTQASFVDLALPGTLPVPNRQAFEYAIMFGLAIDADINKISLFERKNYFYPDLPKGYQTTQLEHPIVGAGHLEIDSNGQSKKIRIHHAHIEEDAGKSSHDIFAQDSGIDLNRAGTPLIEIVSEPDISTAKEAVSLLKKIHAIVTYLGICDGNMSQGSLRCDANVSIRPKGQKELGTRTEIKNINSFKFVEKAINTEFERQVDILEQGGTITQETRLYDSEKNETRSMRSKEEANDYRYFPCPDLLPVEFTDEYIDRLRQSLPEMPDAKKIRFIEQHKLSDADAALITNSLARADFFETCTLSCKAPKLVSNWILSSINFKLNELNLNFEDIPITAEQLSQLIQLIKNDTISSKIAKQVFEEMWNKPQDPSLIVKEKNLAQMSDTGELEAIIDDVIKNNTSQVNNYLSADEAKRKKMLGFFVGQIMKASKGQANPGLVNKLLLTKLT
jgi:aspartyl-tRNA(Asn)/glutamyl-tRNA(Gln) amidotransferase subunit B